MSKNPLFPSLKQKSQSLHQDLKPIHKKNQSSLDKRPNEASQVTDTKTSSINSSRVNNANKTVNFASPTASHFRPTRNSIFYDRRTRNFEVKLSTRVHIFYGLSYVQYDGILRKSAFFPCFFL